MKRFSVFLALVVISLSAGADVPARPTQLSLANPLQKPAEIPLTQKAKVLNTINANQYTYLEVVQNKKTLWLASSAVTAKKNDVIRFDDGMLMSNFYSKTLKRTFPSIAFVNRVVVANEKE
ncbi:MAG: hypothetical protein KGZ83_01655 [Sulfuricella sp.]|nr:hypothetical protein [Sulfuricella sp.]